MVGFDNSFPFDMFFFFQGTNSFIFGQVPQKCPLIQVLQLPKLESLPPESHGGAGRIVFLIGFKGNFSGANC